MSYFEVFVNVEGMQKCIFLNSVTLFGKFTSEIIYEQICSNNCSEYFHWGLIQSWTYYSCAKKCTCLYFADHGCTAEHTVNRNGECKQFQFHNF
jgi:hypothetical protein